MAAKFYVLGVFILMWNTFTITVLDGKECTENDEKRSVEGRLKKDLLCNYDKNERPVRDHKKAVKVEVTMELKRLDFTEYGFSGGTSISVHSWMIMAWKDEYLSWNPAEYGNLKEVQISSNDIWLPGLTIFNGESPTSANGGFDTICLLYNTGNIVCVPHIVHSAICIVNVKAWPFDKHNCTLVLGSWMNAGEEINFVLKSGGIKLGEYLPNQSWNLLSANATRSVAHGSNQTYPQLRYKFYLARHNYDHIATICWPAIVMVMMSLTALLIEANKVERLILLCVNLICNFLSIQQISFFVPKNGTNVPLIMLFFRDSMVTTAFIIIFTIFLRSLSSLKAEMPRWLASVAFIMDSVPGKIIMFSEFDPSSDNVAVINSQVEEDTNKVDSNSKKQWLRLTLFLNRLSFLAVLVVYLVMCVALIPI